MKKDRSVKQRLFSAILVLVMLFTSLLGTTFAWFTDSVSSAGNQIVSGTLKVDLSVKGENDQWVSLKQNSDQPIFNYKHWEPGYTRVEALKVDNLGTLALKYQLSIEVALGTADIGENGAKLSDVIDVYVADGEKTAGSFAEITAANGWTHKGTLTEVMEKPSEFVKGRLNADGKENDNAIVTIALHMQESAGNEYQKLSAGDIFVNLIATQATVESDSFGTDYDDKAEFPEIDIDDLAIEVEVENGLVKTEKTVKRAGISITVPAGVKVDGMTNGTAATLVLSVDEKEKSDANVTLSDDEILQPLDVHVEGVSAQNQKAIVITIEKAMPTGLNMGNYELYHVENGATNVMTSVDAAGVDAHNEFYYDPATGDTTLGLATFSEVAVVADTTKAWEGNFDYSWYTNAVAPVDGESEPDYVIANADQLAAFGAIVGGMNGQTQDSFKDKTVKLIADINLGDKESENNSNIIFYPIGYWNNEGTYERLPADQRVNAVESGFYSFCGTFDGNGHTIENFYQNTWEMKGDHNWYDPIKEQYYRDGMGLFGKVYGGTVKNLTVKNFSSDGEIATTGVIAAYADGATFENIAIFNCNPRVYNIGNGGIVGCVGWYAKEAGLKTTFKNITVDNSNKISALWGSYDVACGGIVGQYYPTSGQTSAGTPKNGGVHFENCHVSAIMDVYNDVCANYQYYAYRYTGMLIGSVRENVTIDGHVYPKMDGITASGCTVHFGTWNDYYYCEIIDNTTASYTHDYQMSRLTEIKAIDGTTITYLDGKTGTVPASGRANYVIVDYTKGHGTENATCYHFKDGAVWTHDMGGIQTGIDENGDGQDDLKEDKQHIYLEFNNLVTGYGWGVTSRGFSNLNGVTNLDITQGDQEASVEKFEDAGYTPKDYRPGETITIGDLFKVKGNAVINGKSVYVSVSPVTEGDKVSATFALNTEDWTKSTITFAADSTGTAKVTITDYIFCTPTTIYLNEEAAVAKFTANPIAAQNAYTQITLGTLFGMKNAATIGNVTATVTDPNGNKTTVTGTSSDWAAKTIDLVKEGTWTVSIVDDDKYCAATETTFTVNKVDKFTKKFDKNFLYRVGNQNAVDVGYIFGEIDTPVKLSTVNVTITNVAGNASGTFTANKSDWTKGTIQFIGTGVVKVIISADGAKDFVLNLEVIDAENLTSAKGYTETEKKNFVLVCDISTTSFVNHWNSTIYGNGFTYSLNGAPTAYNSKQGHGILITKNATLDNLVIVGDVYNSYGAYTTQDCYNAAVDATNTTIQNSYIAHCSAPVRGNGVTIKNSTLYGGTVANMILVGGTNTLEDLITVNYNDDRDVVGLGILVSDSAAADTRIVLNGNLKQYNYVCNSDVSDVPGKEAQAVFNSMFDAAFEDYQIKDSSTTWVNTGIIIMTESLNTTDIISGTISGYQAKDDANITLTVNGITKSVNGAIYAPLASDVDNNYGEYVSTTQGDYLPTFNFDLGNQAIAGEDRYLKGDNSGIEARYLQGENALTLDISKLMTSFKYEGINYPVNAVCKDANGNTVTATNGVITLNTAGSYTIVFTIEDNEFYNALGQKIDKSVTRSYEVPLTVIIAEPAIKDAVITVNKTALDGGYNESYGDRSYQFNPLNAITITDAEGTVNLTTNIASTNIVYASSSSAFAGATTITVTYNDGRVLTIVLGKPSLNSPGSSKAITYENDGTIKSAAKVASKSATGGTWTVTSYSFKGTNGKTVTNNTVVTFTFPDKSCVTGDTLVMLADGTQKRIDQVTYEDQLLVWNFFTGTYDIVPSAIIFYHGDAEYDILNLRFDDGTVVKVINNHGFYDVEQNQFVFIDNSNVEDFIGHHFVKVDGETYTSVELVSYEITTEYTGCYSIQSAMHNNFMVEGMFSLTIPHYEGWFDYFEIGEGMKYDEEKMQADIEKYGLYTYEDFAEYVTYEQFIAFNGPYLKVLVGRGVVTYEQIINLISLYVNP